MARPTSRQSGFWPACVGLVGLCVACVSTWTYTSPMPYHRIAAVDGGDLVGAEECEVCHDEVGGHPLAPAYHEDCEACHGAGENHADSEETAEIRFPANADCLACHQTGRSTHLSWNLSEHEQAGVLCSDCHNPHNREPLHVRRATGAQGAILMHATDTTRLCASCHPQVAAQLNLPSHHPIREGMLECSDCHRPHENRRQVLGARTSLCTSCHQDHAGPWPFEHPPVAEDCMLCHSPHGTHSDNLLATNQPGSCISCHSLPLFHAADASATRAHMTRCTDCHGAVHGSYADPVLRR